MSIELRTVSMKQRGRSGENAETVEVKDKKTGEITLVKVTPNIEVPGCLPEQVEEADKTLKNALSLFGNSESALWDRLIIPFFNDMRRREVQDAAQTGEPSFWQTWYQEHAEFVSKKFAGLTGEDLQKAQTTFAREITTAGKVVPGGRDAVLEMVLTSVN